MPKTSADKSDDSATAAAVPIASKQSAPTATDRIKLEAECPYPHLTREAFAWMDARILERDGRLWGSDHPAIAKAGA